MAERKILTGDVAKAAGYIQLARKLVKTLKLAWVPARKTLTDGTRVEVMLTSHGTSLKIHSPSVISEQLFLMSYFSAETFGTQLGPEYYTVSLSGAFKSKTNLLPKYTALAESFRSIAVSEKNVFISNGIDHTLLKYDRRGNFLNSTRLTNFPYSTDTNGEIIVIASLSVDVGPPEVLTEVLTVYDLNMAQLLEVNMTAEGGGFSDSPENLVIDGLFAYCFADADDMTRVTLSDGAVELSPLPSSSAIFDIFEGEIYTNDTTEDGVVSVFVIEDDGSYTFNRTFGVFGGEPTDENPIDEELDFPPMEPYEFYNNFLYTRPAIAVGDTGVYVSEMSNPAINFPAVDRVVQFTHAGEFVRTFGRQDYYLDRPWVGEFTPRQIRSMDIG